LKVLREEMGRGERGEGRRKKEKRTV